MEIVVIYNKSLKKIKNRININNRNINSNLSVNVYTRKIFLKVFRVYNFSCHL